MTLVSCKKNPGGQQYGHLDEKIEYNFLISWLSALE